VSEATLLNDEQVREFIAHGALISLLGPNYYLHPHRAVHRSTPIDDPTLQFATDVDAPQMGQGSSSGSAWHQDAQSPLARARHHLPRYLIGFYFPHDTPIEMGPTRMQAGSYLYANPVKPQAVILPDDIAAGAFFLVHFDMVHAGFPNRTSLDRYMVKFVFTRTDIAKTPTWNNQEPQWRRPEYCLVDYDLPEAWRHIWNWLRGKPQTTIKQSAASDVQLAEHMANLNQADQVKRLTSIYGLAALGAHAGQKNAIDAAVSALLETQGMQKHERVLARDENGEPLPRDDIRGWPRCWNERAIAMEDATYALAASGPPAIPDLAKLLLHKDPWIQINAAFALGEIGPAASVALPAIGTLLDSPCQQVVRQALDALGAIGCALQVALPRIESLLTQSKPTWQGAQVGRGWSGEDQVRLNAAFALLNAINSGEDLEHIERILTCALDDKTGYVAAVAAEGLVRIGSTSATANAIRYLSDHRWDDTLTGKNPF